MVARAADGWEVVCAVPMARIGATAESVGLLVRRRVPMDVQ